MDSSSILSVAVFVLNSVLLTGFIIPQVQKLKEIKDTLINYHIPYLGRNGNMVDTREEEEKQKEQISKIHSIFDSYRIRSNELNAVIYMAYGSIFFAAICFLISHIWGAVYIFQIKNLGITINSIVIPGHLLIQLILLSCAINRYAIRPDKLQDVHYLATEMDINPHVLINALNLSVSYSSKHGWTKKSSRTDPLEINLNNRLRAFGFRFLYVLSGEKGEVFYVSFGPITSSMKQVWRHLAPPTKYNTDGEYNRVEIGNFQFNLIKDKQDLDVVLLIFIPFYKSEKYSPLIATSKYEVCGIDSNSYSIGCSGGMWEIDSTDLYEKIEFNGCGLKIKNLSFSAEAKDNLDKVVEKVIGKYKDKICRSKKIIQHSSITGKLL